MPALTLKNIPEDLYEALKASASANHRSINSEILVCLEKSLNPVKTPPAERLESIRRVRATVGKGIGTREISKAIKTGRP